MVNSRRLLCSLTGLCIALGTPGVWSAPKHDKHQGASAGQNSAQHQDALQIDLGQVRIILGEHREWAQPAPSLPPGLRKKLARGQPLPPGWAKRLDGRLQERLPRYEGYEWQQIGGDVVLVALATGLIYEVLQDVFD